MTDALTVLQDTIRSCTKCWLHDHGNGPVPYRGPIPAQLLIIGEAPGDTEDKEGEPFVGRSGKWLAGALKKAGFTRNQVGWCNAVSCWPGKTKKGYRVPAIEERDACDGNLKMQVAMARPSVAILAGATALGAFRRDLKLTRDRGRPFYLPGFPDTIAIPTFHPSFALRVHEMKAVVLKDLRQARWRHKRDRAKNAVRWPEDCTVCRDPLNIYDQDGVAWCAKHEPIDPYGEQDAVPTTLDVS